ncbi:hypothetical protein AA313_de0203880 [Arthrobotrys entomopaga]|nr:hypothetical protein AA313_de0203880 [Arthrobotrys entomopaga]
MLLGRARLRLFAFLASSVILTALLYPKFSTRILAPLHIKDDSYNYAVTKVSPTVDTYTASSGYTYPLPPEYVGDLYGTDPWCESRFGLTFIETLAKKVQPYCTRQSRSHIDCMHSEVSNGVRYGTRYNSFCIGQNVVFDPILRKFNFDCQLLDKKDLNGYPLIKEFPDYYSENGIKQILNDHAKISTSSHNHVGNGTCISPQAFEDRFVVLIARSLLDNFWHLFLEVQSYWMSIDVLQMAVNPRTGKPFMTPADFSKIELIITDPFDDHKADELYYYFSENPMRRLRDFSPANSTFCLKNVIMPLPGHIIPWWDSEFESSRCERSFIADSIRKRTLNHFGIPLANRDSQITVTFINRVGRRKLLNFDELDRELEQRYPDVTINRPQFEKMTLREQINMIARTDVLIGVHGAALTNIFFLPPQASVVEILPKGLNLKLYRNLANVRGLRYFSAHAPKQYAEGEEETPKDWYEKDIIFENIDQWRRLIDAAMASVSHKGLLDIDVV